MIENEWQKNLGDTESHIVHVMDVMLNAVMKKVP